MLSPEILELIVKLGALIKEDPRIAAMKTARAAYEEDKGLAIAITEYNAQQAALSEAYNTEGTDASLIEAIEKHLNELYHQIIENPTYSAYAEADEAANGFLAEVNGELTHEITGSYPCSHDCSSCGGGCHDHEDGCDCEDCK